MAGNAPGLYLKYRVERIDGSAAHTSCEYSVLDPPAAITAAAYAASCEVEEPAHAADLRQALVKVDDRQDELESHRLAREDAGDGR